MLITLYLVAIVIANLLVVAFGPDISIINAFLFIGLDLSTRDALHDQWHGQHLWGRMALLIGAGSILSAVLNWNTVPIAIASFVAFGAAGIVDAAVYHALRERARLVRMNGSNVLSAAVDSCVFPVLAFGWPPLLGIILGQFVAKTVGGALWAWLLTRQWRRYTVSKVES